MNKGLIMEIKDDYAIAMCDDGTMEKILVKPGMSVGQKIFYFEEDIVKASSVKKNYRINTFMKGFGSIAALFLIIFTVFQNVMFDKAYAVVSLDINPSIEITADSKQNIIKIEGKNLDGQDIDFQQIKGMNINDGMKKIKDILVEKDYLSKNKDILVAVGFPNNDCDTKYVESVQDIVVSTFDSENIACVTVDKKEDIKEASEKGISLGRYEVYKAADDSVKENIKTVPVKELTAQIKDQDNVVYWDSSKDEINNVPPSDAVKDEKPAVSQNDTEVKTEASTDTSKSGVVNGETNKQNQNQNSKPPSNIKDNNTSDNQGNKQENTSSSTSGTTQEIELKPETPPENTDKKEEVVLPPKEEVKPVTPPDTGSTKPDNSGKVESGINNENNTSSSIEVPKSEPEIK
ncbi:MAG: hypothetical protein Q4F66_03440 [Clostridium sp.]|nr:hypothetical protein [Clostridium sp.]